MSKYLSDKAWNKICCEGFMKEKIGIGRVALSFVSFSRLKIKKKNDT